MEYVAAFRYNTFDDLPVLHLLWKLFGKPRLSWKPVHFSNSISWVLGKKENKNCHNVWIILFSLLRTRYSSSSILTGKRTHFDICLQLQQNIQTKYKLCPNVAFQTGVMIPWKKPMLHWIQYSYYGTEIPVTSLNFAKIDVFGSFCYLVFSAKTEKETSGIPTICWSIACTVPSAVTGKKITGWTGTENCFCPKIHSLIEWVLYHLKNVTKV